MSKEVGKIYSAVDADELEAGDLVVSADNLEEVKISDKVIPLADIKGEDFAYRFITMAPDAFGLAKLVCPKNHVEVYKAWKNGAKVEYKSVYEDVWVKVDNPLWAEDTEYRVSKEVNFKQEPKYRPFKDCDELIATWRKMIGYPAKANTMPLIWVRSNDGTTVCITAFGGKKSVGLSWFNKELKDLEKMFDSFTFLDETPFGVKEE